MDVQVIIRNRWVQTAAISVVSTTIGSGLGYVLGKRQGKKDVQNDIFKTIEEGLEELDEIRRNFVLRFENVSTAKIVDEEVFPEGLPVVEPEASLKNMMRSQLEETTGSEEVIIIEPEEEVEIAEEDDPANKKSLRTDEEEDAPVRVSIFTVDDGSWIYEDELATRTPDEPYVIHRDEFIEDEMGFHQETVTYYGGDQMMGDSRDKPIYGFHKIMGELKFGHGSGDKSVVYIRNEKMRMEWEVLLHPGQYALEVLGFEAERGDEELKHSVQRFRREE